MLDIIKTWEGRIEIDGTSYNSYSEIPSNLVLTNGSTITLHSKLASSSDKEAKASSGVYRVEVRQYMTKESTPEFDFMQKWNNNIPMPMRIMVGTYDKETRGMYHMNLHADIIGERMFTCMKCGKALTNPVSQYFGIGPECGGHNYVHPFSSDEELKATVDEYRKELQNITWSGWVIKSAITNMEEIVC